MKKFFAAFLFVIFCCCSVFASENKDLGAGKDVSQLSLIKPYKDISKRIIVINKLKTQTKNLNNEDKNVIKKYVFGAVRGEDTFLLINCYLRNCLEKYIPRKEITKPLKSRLDYYARALSTPISKAKLPQNILLYRSLSEKEMEILFGDKKIDSVIKTELSDKNLIILKQHIDDSQYEEKGFITAYYDKNCIKKTKFVLEICAPKNLQAICMEEIDKKRAKEVIINKQTTWKVTDINIDSNKNGKFYKIRIKYVR